MSFRVTTAPKDRFFLRYIITYSEKIITNLNMIDNLIRVVVFGTGSVGKTAITTRFCNDVFITQVRF